MSRIAPLVITICSVGHPVFAGTIPNFINRAEHIPTHVYAGGWEHFVGGGLAVFDCNDDGLSDLFAAGGENPVSLWKNTSKLGGSLSFESVESLGISGATGAYPVDIDSDGVTDLAVLRVGENKLLRGLGNCQFEEANALWNFDGGDRWTTSFAATWEGDNARPTLFFGNYVNRDDPDGPFEACDHNELHRPNTDSYEKTRITPGFCALSALMSKANRPETALRISNDRHYYVSGGYEQLYDLTQDRFFDETDGWQKVSLWGMGIAERDIDSDGYMDVMMTSMGDQLLQFGGPNGSYTSAPYDIGTYAQRPHVGDDGRASTGWHAQWGDVDNDGKTDLFITKGNVDQMPGLAAHDPNNLLKQKEDGTFREVSVAAGIASLEKSRGAAMADFNGDGLLDIAVVNRGAPLEIYENTTQGAGKYLLVSLAQEGINTRGVGALVEVLTNTGLQQQEITVGGGHASGQDTPLHFGLANASTAQIRVTWPDGDQSPWVEIEKFNRWVKLGW